MSNTPPETPPAAAPGAEDMLEIPPNVLVGCPLTHPRLARVEGCVQCPYFVGFGDRFKEGGSHPFAVRYLLTCKHPRNLPLTEVQA